MRQEDAGQNAQRLLFFALELQRTPLQEMQNMPNNDVVGNTMRMLNETWNRMDLDSADELLCMHRVLFHSNT